ncbi:DNA polymerase beta superfamily protein [Herbiconiux solani]|uniref:DNA polymerase beta superfamily protein n=1 Tax=Herbiconiux solani TaxID=661329 RepID=UPI000826F199|nr:nucleotidyltransferase domain-containing protein [Herbiconiux solani]
MDARQVIVSAEYGSTALGVATAGSDRDVMSVFVEEPRQVTGIEPPARAVSAHADAEGIDRVLYPLRKWAALAAAGNPTTLLLLWAPALLDDSAEWQRVLGIRDAFVSREAGERFRGYARSQREAMTGGRSGHPARPELVREHGFDTKYGYHLVRVALQGIELMETGALQLPLVPRTAELLGAIRRGAVPLEEVLALADELDVRLAEAIAASSLPDEADRARIDEALHAVHLSCWARS